MYGEGSLPSGSKKNGAGSPPNVGFGLKGGGALPAAESMGQSKQRGRGSSCSEYSVFTFKGKGYFSSIKKDAGDQARIQTDKTENRKDSVNMLVNFSIFLYCFQAEVLSKSSSFSYFAAIN